MVFQSNVSRGSLHCDLSSGADLRHLSFFQAEQQNNLMHHLPVIMSQPARLALRVLKLQVPNPKDGRQHLKEAIRHLRRYVQYLHVFTMHAQVCLFKREVSFLMVEDVSVYTLAYYHIAVWFKYKVVIVCIPARLVGADQTCRCHPLPPECSTRSG